MKDLRAPAARHSEEREDCHAVLPGRDSPLRPASPPCGRSSPAGRSDRLWAVVVLCPTAPEHRSGLPAMPPAAGKLGVLLLGENARMQRVRYQPGFPLPLEDLPHGQRGLPSVQIESLLRVPRTLAGTNVNYFSIKLGRKRREWPEGDAEIKATT